MLEQATAELYKDNNNDGGGNDEVPSQAKDTTYIRKQQAGSQLGEDQKQRDVESQRAQTPKKAMPQFQGSNVFSGDENPTFGSTIDIAKQTSFSAVKLLDQTRSISVQPQVGGLPSIGKPLQQAQSTKFQNMVYGRNFVLNIDNQATNRNNQHYVSGYYKQLTDQSVIPQNEKLSYRSLRTLDYKSPMRSTSVAFPQTEAKRMLNEPSAEVSLAESLKQQRFQPLQEASRTIQQTEKLPNLFQDTIVQNLDNGIQLSAKQRAAIIFGQTDRKRHRKDVTHQLIGMPDYESQTSERSYKPKGQLEKPKRDDEIQSQKTESYINSSVFNVLEQNHSDYLNELELEKQRVQRQNLKIRNQLIPADRIKFDQDPDFQRQSILNAQKQREEDGIKTVEDIEPERNIEKLRARLKLHGIKKYTEDEKLRKELEQKAKLADERLTSAQKRRKKHDPIKRRRSFTEMQLKFETSQQMIDEDAEEGQLSLMDKNTISKMTLGSRFPIPEALMNKPRNYWLKIDSLVHNIYNVDSLLYTAQIAPDLKAPQNSDVSSDNLSINGDSSDEELREKKRLAALQAAKDGKVVEKPKIFKKEQVDLQPWSISNLLVFPHKARDGEMPKSLLNKAKTEYLVLVSKTLEEYQKDPKYQMSMIQIQAIFEHYCGIFKIQPIPITDFIVPCENARIKFSMRHVQISENLNKAIACTIPFIYNIYECEFINNQITDIMSPLLIMAAFVNPSVRRYSYCANKGQNSFKRTFDELKKASDMKFIEVNLTRSIQQLEHLEKLSKSFSYNLFKLNISGNSLSINATRILNVFLLKQQYIKDLNLSKCRLSNQSARYIIDALNRNVTIRHLNLSGNDFGSSIYEFGIKVSSMLTRQPTLLHCDISNCGFKREESMFIILAMSTSKNFLSLHMTGNELPYYERVFMRSLIAARVQFTSKDQMQRQEIKMNKERYQVMQLAKHEHYADEIKDYLETFDKLEEARQGLDFEIEDLLKELNLDKLYQENEGIQSLEDLPKDSKLSVLISKMMERNTDLTEQQSQVKQMMKLTAPQIKAKLQQNNGVLNETARKLQQQEGDLQAAFNAKAELQKERQRQRAELEAAKGKQERSAGEMALLFMGINQVAFDLLIENPMTGYMNEIIFTRILGHDDIEQGHFWADATICYICHKWEKQTIQFDPRHDDSKWSQRITQVDSLQSTIDNLYSQAQEVEEVKQQERYEQFKKDQEFEKKRRQALGEESSSANGDEEADKTQTVKLTLKDQNDQDYLKAFDTPHSKLKLNLNPDRKISQKAVLINVGPDMLSPKFSGQQGLIPPAENFSFRVTQGTPVVKGEINQKYKAQSTIDGGVYSTQLDRTPSGMEVQLERQDTPLDKKTRPQKKPFNTEQPLVPQHISLKNVQKQIFPEQFINTNDFEELNLRHSNPATPEAGQSRPINQAEHAKYMMAKQISRYGGPPGGMPGAQKPKQTKRQPSMTDLTQQVMCKQQENQMQNRPMSHQSQQPSMVTSIQQDRRRGQPQKIQRTLFFGGMVYVIEEEVYSDSDNSSVYTSEDDFEEEKNMFRHYVAQTDDYHARLADEAEARRQALLNPVKTAKELRLEKLGIVEESKKVLSEAQKAYKSKIWPKHYIPYKREEKSQNIDSVGLELNLKVGAVKVGKRVDESNQIVSGPLPNKQDIYIVGSFNDWMPVKLKTQRELTMEKINPDEPIPKSTFVIDNHIFVHANYMPPGKHYFYFVKQEGMIILSPKYEIVRFKATNVFLNQVTVRPRIYDFDAVNVVRGGDDEEQIFLKDKSVFRDFRDDTKMYLKKCFDQDIAYTKIQRTVKGEEDGTLDDIKRLLFEHYIKINNIFLYYIGISTYPTIGLNDFTSWANKCDLVDGKWINLAALDRILITTNVALHGLISSAERDLNRYEFLEILVRLSIAKYRDSKICDSTPQATLKLLFDNIFPNSFEVNGDGFRRFQCYNVKVNEILQKNITVIKKIYDSYTHQKKKFIRLDECREYIIKAELKVSQMQCGVLFSESMQTLVDTIIDQERPNQMKFVEFLVFLCRCAFEHYNGTPYENEMMYLKLEKLLPQMLAPMNVSPLFLFYEDFEYKPMAKKGKKEKKVKKEAVVADDGQVIEPSEQTDSEDEEESEEDDMTSEDDLGECVVLEEGKFKLSDNYVAKMKREQTEKEQRRQERILTRQKKLEEKEQQAEARRVKKEAVDELSDGHGDDDKEQVVDQGIAGEQIQ